MAHVLRGRRYNRQKQLALEAPTWFALLALISPYFEKKEGLIGVKTSPQKAIAFWQWGITLTWFRRNNEKASYGTHTPDFVIKQYDKPHLAIECKNVNRRIKIYHEWFMNEVVSRFENYRKCRKLAIFSYFVPAPKDRAMIYKTRVREKITIIELGRQALSSKVPDLGIMAIPLRAELSTNVTKIVDKLKPVTTLERFSK